MIAAGNPSHALYCVGFRRYRGECTGARIPFRSPRPDAGARTASELFIEFPLERRQIFLDVTALPPRRPAERAPYSVTDFSTAGSFRGTDLAFATTDEALRRFDAVPGAGRTFNRLRLGFAFRERARA